MDQEMVGTGFQAVDEASNPDWYFEMLDMQAAEPAIQTVRRLSIERCAPAPGLSLLDIGCGLGEVVREIGPLLAPGGRAVGVDSSERMIGEARRRTPAADAVDFGLDDAQSLSFEDASFDVVRSERVFQHLADPVKALGEAIRVAKPGGRVVIVDTDWETAAVDHPDEPTTRSMTGLLLQRFAHPSIGRRLRGMFLDAGLAGVTTDPVVFLTTSWDPDSKKMSGPPLQTLAAEAAERGLLTKEQSEEWFRAVADRARAGRFLWAVTMYIVAGTKPV